MHVHELEHNIIILLSVWRFFIQRIDPLKFELNERWVFFEILSPSQTPFLLFAKKIWLPDFDENMNLKILPMWIFFLQTKRFEKCFSRNSNLEKQQKTEILPELHLKREYIGKRERKSRKKNCSKWHEIQFFFLELL